MAKKATAEGERGTFEGGVPTRPDVQQLVDLFGLPPVGHLIPYTAIEEALKLRRHCPRWIAVIGSWKRKLSHEHNLEFETVANQGYRVADNPTRVHKAGRSMVCGFKRVARGGDLAARTADDGLDDNAKRARDDMSLVAARIKGLIQVQAKSIDWVHGRMKRENGA